MLGIALDVMGLLQSSDAQTYQPWVTFELFFLLLDMLIVLSAIVCAFAAKNRCVKLTARIFCGLLLALLILSLISNFL